MHFPEKARGTTLKAAQFALLAFVWVLCWGCKEDVSQNEAAFYHWKTAFSPSEYEQERMASLGANRLYIKYFDIDQQEGESEPIPLAKVQFSRVPKQEIVPTIYLTNRTIKRVGQEKADWLAERSWKLIRRLHPAEAAPIREVQMDCDWTPLSREAYFEFLRAMKKQVGKDIKLSATIRLHQFKHHNLTGVPPIDRGMLMYYNMGDLEDPDEFNSILDIKTGRQYLHPAQAYPLELDIALPIFAWGVLIIQGKPSKLMHNLRQEEVEDLPWMHKVAPNILQVDTSHYLRGLYLLPGDQIRLESISPEDLATAAEDLKKALPDHRRHIAFYHLDSLNLSKFSDEMLLDALK